MNNYELPEGDSAPRSLSKTILFAGIIFLAIGTAVQPGGGSLFPPKLLYYKVKLQNGAC